jgi:CubicO group peptidase (beta-lactamase class C family)
MARSHHRRRTQLGAACAAFAIAGTISQAAVASAHKSSHQADIASARTALNAYIDALPVGTSGSVIVAQGGKIIVDRGFGTRDPATGAPNQSDTQYGIASQAKTFTSTAIYQLARKHKLNLDDPISKFFPNAPADRKTATLRQIMTMTSGLPEYVAYMENGIPGDFVPLTSASQAVDREFTQDLMFSPPGSDQQYSDGSYGLLAAVVEKVAKEPFARYIRETILDKVGMDHTGWYGERLAATDRYAHVSSPPPLGTQDDTNPRFWPATWAQYGAGAMVSRTGDLYKFIENGLCHGQVLTAAEQKVAYTVPAPFTLYQSVGYNLNSPEGITQARGGGDDWGHSATWWRNTAKDTTVVLNFNNKTDDTDGTNAIAGDLQHIAATNIPSAGPSLGRCVI